MDSSNTNELTRSDKPGWSVIASGDNEIDLLQYVIKVTDFTESVRVGAEVASLITPHEQTDDVFNTQITLMGWRVEIQLALPKGSWGTLAQQELTDAIVELSR